MKYCDLHAHTIFSDGTYTPEELVEEAKQKGLSAVALTLRAVTVTSPNCCEASSMVNVPKLVERLKPCKSIYKV